MSTVYQSVPGASGRKEKFFDGIADDIRDCHSNGSALLFFAPGVSKGRTRSPASPTLTMLLMPKPPRLRPLYAFGDSEGTRTPDLQRDRLAFYATELRSHIGLIDFSLNLYVYIISEISIKIKLFLSKFSLVESAKTLLVRLHRARSPLFICWESLSHFPKRLWFPAYPC